MLLKQLENLFVVFFVRATHVILEQTVEVVSSVKTCGGHEHDVGVPRKIEACCPRLAYEQNSTPVMPALRS